LKVAAEAVNPRKKTKNNNRKKRRKKKVSPNSILFSEELLHSIR
jgi:hypothetical protein